MNEMEETKDDFEREDDAVLGVFAGVIACSALCLMLIGLAVAVFA
jgi:hypothetical protein